MDATATIQTFHTQAERAIAAAVADSNPLVKALATMLDTALTANELMSEQFTAVFKELIELRGLLGAMPNRLAKLIELQNSLFVEVDVRFVKCPNCKNEVPRFSERTKGQCGICKTFIQYDENTVTHPQLLPLADVIFDSKLMSPKDQAAFLVPLLTGKVKIEARCTECKEVKAGCTCPPPLEGGTA